MELNDSIIIINLLQPSGYFMYLQVYVFCMDLRKNNSNSCLI